VVLPEVIGLLSRDRPVAVSSVQSWGLAGQLAVDGDSDTRWSSAFADPQWIAVDLGGSHVVSRVRLNWERAYGRAYQIQVSTDGNMWTTVYNTTSGNGGVDDLTVIAIGRYVRVSGTQRGTVWGYSLWDFEVYGV
jgi:cytochrome c